MNIIVNYILPSFFNYLGEQWRKFAVLTVNSEHQPMYLVNICKQFSNINKDINTNTLHWRWLHLIRLLWHLFSYASRYVYRNVLESHD